MPLLLQALGLLSLLVQGRVSSCSWFNQSLVNWELLSALALVSSVLDLVPVAAQSTELSADAFCRPPAN
jgi:hypothetical protein